MAGQLVLRRGGWR